jgi:hypothetical protein
MGKLNKYGYQQLIDQNIEALEKYMPEHSLEKKHTIEVLKWSVNQIYGGEGNPANSETANCAFDVSGSDILILLERKSPTVYEIHRKEIRRAENLVLTTTDKEFAERLVNGYNHYR